MRRPVLRLLAAAVTFVVGVGGTYLAWLAYHGYAVPVAEEVRIPPFVPAPSRPDGHVTPRVATSIGREWEAMTGAEFCLVGGQHYSPERNVEASDSRVVGEGAFNPYGWLPSLREDKRAAAAFLIKQIPDRSPTRVHVCPLATALKGELAVYCLQHALKVNWYELKDDYKRRFDSASDDSPTGQALLRKIIGTEQGAEEMMNLWAGRLEAGIITE